jgi:hypothetical protein
MPLKTYRQYAEELSPTVLLGTWGARFVVGSIGLMADLIAQRAREARKASLLTAESIPTDALPLKGYERLSPRYPADTDATYKARLIDSWERWKQGGSEQGMIAELEAYGLTDISIVLDSEWDWDGEEYWSRFWVVIKGHAWTGPRLIGDAGSMLDGTWTLGSSATPEEVNAVRSIVRRWKPGHMICSYIIPVLNEATWDAEQPDGTWARNYNRSTAACYWPG